MSGDASSAQEKSHDASPQRLEEARRKGDLARSLDAQTAAAYLGFWVAMALAGAAGAAQLGTVLIPFLDRPEELGSAFLSPAGGGILAAVVSEIAIAVGPLFLAPGAIVLVLLLAQRGIVFAPEKLMPKLSRISLIENAKQKYGPHGLVEFLKSATKLLAVGGVTVYVLADEADRLTQYVQLEARSLPLLLEQQVLAILVGVLILSAAIGFFDFMWQRQSHLKKLRMTHQDVRDESKRSEGDPQLRQSRRERALEVANNRMLHDVPTADVVIVNPEHYAVALKWTREPGTAPVCVAKGVDEIALRIRRKAAEVGVPIHEDPPTARAVHASVEIGQSIPSEHYKAVAAAIVFADRLRGRAEAGGRRPATEGP